MGFDQLDKNVLGIVALICSAIALLQIFVLICHQFLLSAKGFDRCSEPVIGLWSKSTYRRFNMKEFRFEVVFETPLVSIACLIDSSDPVGGRETFYIDGTTKSYRNTRVFEPDLALRKNQTAIQQIHTADDEQSSWVALLSSLHHRELESRAWDEQVRLRSPHMNGMIKGPEYELVVGIQVESRRWSFVPDIITRPYATTTLSHMIEMAALMGIYWRVFDQSQWSLRAEGNGFNIISEIVHNLGVMIKFTIVGKSVFRGDLVIPSNQIKELCFGSVPDIFEDRKDLTTDSMSQSLFLNFGSQDNVELTLESLGCTPELIEGYKKNHKHIFPISFEIIGMLGKVVRLRKSAFRMISNPTQDYWLKKVSRKPSWRITKLMTGLLKKLAELSELEGYIESHFEDHTYFAIMKKWEDIESLGYIEEYDLSIEVREKIHDAIDERTEFLLDETRQTDVFQVIVAHLEKVTKALNDDTFPLCFMHSVNKEEALIEYYFDTILCSITQDADEKEQRHIIWVSLIFRMLCWLLLHDWHKDDKCRVPSDLKGSRMPIFIG
ncbi:hypothetical protein BGAL_1109g00010 [Botrytis galanthina]|uniref:Modin n=1 Tax=Botrytis galanthina TaxID=278940 RepID=A0A4S8QG28_9HELO|nr:hypothetical protein BGAL_1109g00010 [Botrytis galanthina]